MIRQLTQAIVVTKPYPLRTAIRYFDRCDQDFREHNAMPHEPDAAPPERLRPGGLPATPLTR